MNTPGASRESGASVQLSLMWPDSRAPGRYVYRHVMHHDELYTVFAASRENADNVLRVRMRVPSDWELVEHVQFIPPSLRKPAAMVADGRGVRPIHGAGQQWNNSESRPATPISGG